MKRRHTDAAPPYQRCRCCLTNFHTCACEILIDGATNKCLHCCRTTYEGHDAPCPYCAAVLARLPRSLRKGKKYVYQK